MTLGQHGNCVRFSTADFLYVHLAKSDDQLGFGLVRTAILVLGHAARVWMAELTTASTTPRVQSPFNRQSHSMGITTGDLDHLDSLEEVDKTWCWLVRVALNVRW